MENFRPCSFLSVWDWVPEHWKQTYNEDGLGSFSYRTKAVKEKKGCRHYLSFEVPFTTSPCCGGRRVCFMVSLHGKSLPCFSATICEKEKEELFREDRKDRLYFYPVV